MAVLMLLSILYMQSLASASARMAGQNQLNDENDSKYFLLKRKAENLDTDTCQ